jgi:hypothetical protein
MQYSRTFLELTQQGGRTRSTAFPLYGNYRRYLEILGVDSSPGDQSEAVHPHSNKAKHHNSRNLPALQSKYKRFQNVLTAWSNTKPRKPAVYYILLNMR